MRFLSSLALLAMLGTCHVPSLLAQGRDPKELQPTPLGVINDIDVTVTDITEERINNVPKREIKIEKVAEPWKSKLTKADPKLFEQKFVAKCELLTPTNGIKFQGDWSDDPEIAPLQSIGDYPLLYPRRVSSGSSKITLGETLKLMTKFVPAGSGISKENLEFFGDLKTVEDLLLVSHADRHWRFLVLGNSAEQAEERLKAMLVLLDQGASRPMRLALFKRRQTFSMKLREHRKLAEEAPKSVKSLTEMLKSYADFSSDMLPNLRVQQLQLDVDLAGVKARIAACEKLLAQPSLKSERRSQIEDLKVTAEIELSGIEAKRAKSEEIIGKVKTRSELVENLNSAQTQLRGARLNVASFEKAIREFDEAIAAYAPLPLVDNKIIVQPLEWTQ